jgi:hypothetical protein
VRIYVALDITVHGDDGKVVPRMRRDVVTDLLEDQLDTLKFDVEPVGTAAVFTAGVGASVEELNKSLALRRELNAIRRDLARKEKG